MTRRASREQALAFRLAAQNLARPLPVSSLLEAAACGLQDSPPSSAALALRARVEGLTSVAYDRALAAERTLVKVRSLRAAPYVVPAGDLPLFTAGILPADEGEVRGFIRGAVPALEKVEITGAEVVERTAAALRRALDGRVVPFRRLSEELIVLVARGLGPRQLAGWQSPSWYGPNLSLGEAIVHFALYVVALEGIYCYAPREGDEASFVLLDQWLGRPLPPVDPALARAGLVRRYLRYYGPSTAGDFAAWTGIAPGAARRAWDLAAPTLVAVNLDGRETWLHEDDLTAFAAPPEVKGVRLLPPSDPYLAQRDREILLPDLAARRRLWRAQGAPGAVLVDGHLVALWRPRKTGTRLAVTVEPLVTLSPHVRAAISAAVEALATFRGCIAGETAFVG